MNFSQETLDQIQELASVFLPNSDIAVIIGVEPYELKAEIRNYDSPVRASYFRGKASSKAALLQQEMKLAKIGSPLGLDSVRKAMHNMDLDE